MDNSTTALVIAGLSAFVSIATALIVCFQKYKSCTSKCCGGSTELDLFDNKETT